METLIYFPHDAYTMSDPRIIRLFERHKGCGYGAYIFLLEQLRKEPGYRIHQSKIKTLSRAFNVKPVYLRSILDDFGLFMQDEEYYYSEDLNHRMKKYDNKKCKNLLIKELEEKTKMLKMREEIDRLDALLNKSKEEEIKEEEEKKEEENIIVKKKKEKAPDDDETFESGGNEATERSEELAGQARSDSSGRTDGTPGHSSSAPGHDGGDGSVREATERSEEVAGQARRDSEALKKSISAMEALVDKAFHDQCWLEVTAMNQHLPVPYLQHIPQMSRVFKDQIIQQGKVYALRDPQEVKRYFVNFVREGSSTRARLDQRMQAALTATNPYPFEDIDPVTRQRSVCGMPIPPDAPPRPDNSMRWNVDQKRWSH